MQPRLKKNIVFDSHEECKSLSMVSVGPTDTKNFNFPIFSDTTDVINVKLCMTVQWTPVRTNAQGREKLIRTNR